MKKALKWTGIGVGVLVGLFGVLVLLAVNGIIGPPQVSAAAIASSVSREPTQMAAAFALPAASRYGRDLHWQANGSFCGPASLVNVFRSLGGSVSREDDLLAGTGKCSLGLCWMGLTLDELAEVARHYGHRDRRDHRGAHNVTVLRDLDPKQFQAHLRASNDPAVRYVVNFSRRPIFGGGGGHHSPIGGYLEPEDMVLVLDVNSDYRPWLIERERLFAAMDTLDGDKKRGLLRISRR